MPEWSNETVLKNIEVWAVFETFDANHEIRSFLSLNITQQKRGKIYKYVISFKFCPFFFLIIFPNKRKMILLRNKRHKYMFTCLFLMYMKISLPYLPKSAWIHWSESWPVNQWPRRRPVFFGTIVFHEKETDVGSSMALMRLIEFLSWCCLVYACFSIYNIPYVVHISRLDCYMSSYHPEDVSLNNPEFGP